MAAFDSVTAAVNCARAIQQSFERFNHASVEPIRIGLDCGEPIEDSRDLFGATVQRGSRLCSAAETDQILASASVSEKCGDGGFPNLGCPERVSRASPWLRPHTPGPVGTLR
jgi:class 3 adenylate cyclase